MRDVMGLWLLALLLAAPVLGSGAEANASITPPAPEPAGGARALLQSGVSCAPQIPACTARRCTTRIVANKETYVCLRCKPGYVPVLGADRRSIVQCVCPRGLWESPVTNSCVECGRGFTCAGGDRAATRPSDDRGSRRACNPKDTVGLTTVSTRATALSECVALAGYALPRATGMAAVECPASTYTPALNRLRSCLPCQSGLREDPAFTASGTPRGSRTDVCKVPPGKFWELNVVRDCPKGLYREGFANTTDAAAIRCLSCPEGWTTSGTAATSVLACNRLLPGFKVTSLEAGGQPGLAQEDSILGSPTEACPLGFYFDGAPGTFGCQRCPFGTVTRERGTESANDCLVPPGYYVQAPPGEAPRLAKCPTNVTAAADGPPSGFYRTGWVPPTPAVMDADGTKACTPCGVGILSKWADPDEQTDVAVLRATAVNGTGEAAAAAAAAVASASAQDPGYGWVASSSASCYIKAGWGITFDPADFSKLRAVIPCPANTYGVAGDTFGLYLMPCKSCTKNLKSAPGSSSAADCKNPAGFGYTSEGANQCPDGFWAAAASMDPCEPCPEGRYTDYFPGDGQYQSSIDSCKVPKGYGVFNGLADDPWAPEAPSASMGVRQCPDGFSSPGDQELGGNTSNPVCTRCAAGSATSGPGAESCNVCMAGWGGPPGACAVCPRNTYQPGAEWGDGSTCRPCPRTVWNHNVGDAVTSYGITFHDGSPTPYMCVPRYSQTAKPAGDRLALPDSMFRAVPGATDPGACAAACPRDACCVAEFDAEFGSGCRHAVLPAASPASVVASVSAGADAPRLYYKLPPSDLIAAASIGNGSALAGRVTAKSAAAPGNATAPPLSRVEAKTWASGVYAVCDLSAYADEAAGGWIGTSPDPYMVEAGRDAIEWDVPGLCAGESECQRSCAASSSCWGFLYVPGKGYALRTGEVAIAVRTFFVSPDPETPLPAPPTTLPDPSGDAAPDPSGDAAPAPAGDTAPTPAGDPQPAPSGDPAAGNGSADAGAPAAGPVVQDPALDGSLASPSP
ncbi:hypothetical protein HT031_003717 [Scenedesmus sp. PABB004]|nr:hypothetical protein HT031_003717 [Scenedesmus sp. PABB004]